MAPAYFRLTESTPRGGRDAAACARLPGTRIEDAGADQAQHRSGVAGGPTIKSATYRKVVFGNVSTVLSAAVDDERIGKNPAKAGP